MGRFERGILRFFLSLYPRDFRTEIRDEWMEFVREQRGEEKYEGKVWGRLRFWVDVTRLSKTIAGLLKFQPIGTARGRTWVSSISTIGNTMRPCTAS